jgi:6-phosphogluconolactonase/glucosamine-6-phosphate isomerase/deaminase
MTSGVPDVIRAARKVFVIAVGQDKAPAVAQALEGSTDLLTCPAQVARFGHWILDPAAAARLSNALDPLE